MIKINSFYDTDTGSFTHLLIDIECKVCAVIDPVLGFDIHSGRLSTKAVTAVIEQIQAENLQLLWILETHAHADHLTAARQLKKHCAGQIAVSDGIRAIQQTFKTRFDFADSFSTTGQQFDRLLTNSTRLPLGNGHIEVLSTPGHTSDSCCYIIEDNIFIGDTLFHPSTGTARCDFPGGDAAMLFNSIQTILSYPDATKLYLCHDYPDAQRQPEAMVSILEMRENIHLKQSHHSLNEFVKLRTERDQQLDLPKLIIPAIQVNIAGGILVDELNSTPVYLKWPLNAF